MFFGSVKRITSVTCKIERSHLLSFMNISKAVLELWPGHTFYHAQTHARPDEER